ncbi:MAG TPA: O-antigen ligase family protein [Candidatus Limnocylindrales bacterium]|nr:O-antigen ligase family protein [Candidatus Limnocylindrales bacterium]
MNFLKFLFYLILLTLPLGELLRIEIGKNIILKPIDLLVGLSGITTIIIYSILKQRRIAKSYITNPLAFFAAIALISLIINSISLQSVQIFTSLLYWIRFVSYALIYYLVLILDKPAVKHGQRYLFISGVIFMILGFVQYFLYANLRNLYYLGWDEHNYRLFSTFLDPNFAGAFLVLFLIYLAAFLNSFLSLREKAKAIKVSIVSVLTLVAVFLTYSRSALIMLLVSITTYFFLIGKKKFLLLPSVLIVSFLIILSPTFNKENTNIFRTTSSFARLETYSNALRIIYDNPVIGVGFNAYRYAQESYGFHPISPKYPDHASSGTDNSFLFIAATTGIFGLSAYLFLFYKVVVRALFLNKKRNKIIPPVVIASISGLIVNSFFINSLFYPSIMLWMWVLIGLMDQE